MSLEQFLITQLHIIKAKQIPPSPPKKDASEQGLWYSLLNFSDCDEWSGKWEISTFSKYCCRGTLLESWKSLLVHQDKALVAHGSKVKTVMLQTPWHVKTTVALAQPGTKAV